MLISCWTLDFRFWTLSVSVSVSVGAGVGISGSL